MSRKDDLLNQMMIDRRLARIVLYLEGQSDVPIFFGLLGVPLPTGSPKSGYLYGDCLVRGLRSDDDRVPGSGAGAVSARVELAARTAALQGHFFGLLDGDGRTLSELAPLFDPPCQGPLFSWKSYCIENLLIQAGWPREWGAQPAWPEVLLRYAPYVGLTKLWLEIQHILSDLGLRGFARPDHARLKTADEVQAALLSGRDRLMGYDVAHRFQQECERFSATLQRSADEAHALVNGKWLVSWVAVGRRQSTQDCVAQWAEALAQQGGAPAVRALWRRLTGQDP